MKHSLQKKIQRAIEDEQTGEPLDDERDFSRLAGELFRYQYEENEPYRRFCNRRGVDPQSVDTYRDIPAVPTAVFKNITLKSGFREPEVVFRTSGTTKETRGEHHLKTTEFYRASLLEGFDQFVRPENGYDAYLSLIPGFESSPDSSLSYMIATILETWGAETSGVFVGSRHFDEPAFRRDAFEKRLDVAEDEQIDLCILATAYALLDVIEHTNQTWNLSSGTHIMETGGFKTRTTEINEFEFYERIKHTFGIESSQIVSEYGMTELSSQAYAKMSSEGKEKIFQTPPWVRIEIVEPSSLDILEDGREGLIRWYDLANVWSVLCVQTADFGRKNKSGFEFLGRAEGSELRGCSLRAEEILE